MKVAKYYQVNDRQIIFLAFLVSVIAVALGQINSAVIEYLQLPQVYVDDGGKCTKVVNYKNGEAYMCSDVGTILRKYRTVKNNNDDVCYLSVLCLPSHKGHPAG